MNKVQLMQRQGYARVSGKLGYALFTSGPGCKPMPLQELEMPMLDSTPLVVIAGQVGSALLGSGCFSGN